MAMVPLEGWETLGKKTDRDKPGKWFSLAEQTLQAMAETCVELFPASLSGVMHRESSAWSEVSLTGCEELLPSVFRPYCMRTPDYMIETVWKGAGERCVYQMMCEETPSGHILIRIYQYRKGENGHQRMDGGVVVYVRRQGSIPDSFRYRRRIGDRDASFTIPVEDLTELSREELVEKDLLFFLPFCCLAQQEAGWDAHRELEALRERILEKPMKPQTKSSFLGILEHVLEQAAKPEIQE